MGDREEEEGHREVAELSLLDHLQNWDEASFEDGELLFGAYVIMQCRLLFNEKANKKIRKRLYNPNLHYGTLISFF